LGKAVRRSQALRIGPDDSGDRHMIGADQKIQAVSTACAVRAPPSQPTATRGPNELTQIKAGAALVIDFDRMASA
jgi:hypothetical protein